MSQTSFWIWEIYSFNFTKLLQKDYAYLLKHTLGVHASSTNDYITLLSIHPYNIFRYKKDSYEIGKQHPRLIVFVCSFCLSFCDDLVKLVCDRVMPISWILDRLRPFLMSNTPANRISNWLYMYAIVFGIYNWNFEQTARSMYKNIVRYIS